MRKIKMILDTDIGDDIDDAFALAFAVNHKDLDLIGITTVFKHTKARAYQAGKYLNTIGREDIDVCVGIETPIIEPIRYFEKDKPNKDGIVLPPQYDSTYDGYQISKQDAIDFIIEKSKTYKDELVVVPIGPLTNIAAAIQKEPNIMKNIKKIVLMGGWFNNEKPEWNILCDPEAADIVFKSGIPIYAVGLDVTLQCTVEQSLLNLIKHNASSHGKLLALWFDRWIKHFDFEKSVMHDPLAIATLVSDVCTFEPKYVSIDLDKNRGAITINQKEGSLVHVATNVDKNLFYKLFKETIYGL